MYPIRNKEDIKIGEASIFTVIDGDEVEEFKINILKVNTNETSTKYIIRSN